MVSFPTLSLDPEYPIGIQHLDNSIKAAFQAGYEVRRPRYSRPRRRFKLTYRGLSTADKNTLETFFNEVGTGIAFQWTYPNEADDDYAGTTFEVYFDEPPNLTLEAPGLWQATLTLIEV